MIRRAALASVLSLALVAACSAAPPPPPEPPRPPPPAPVVEAPKPKPCESMDEKCEGASGAKAKIAGSELVFEPATGWVYAQEAAITLAQASDVGAAVALLGHDKGDAKTEAANREAALDGLVKKLGIVPPKKKIAWKKPLDVKDVAELKVSLWQVEGASRGEKKGPLLVFSAALGPGKSLLGVGFVPDDDASGADGAILKSIESLAPSGAATAEATP